MNIGKRIKIPPFTVIGLLGLIIIEPTEYLAMILGAVALHEAGHLAVMRLCGVGVASVTLLPVGIDIKRNEELIPYHREILISVAGVATNLLMFSIFRKYEFFAMTNLLYALTNLLPIKGLDGGNTLEAILLCFCSPGSAEKVLDAVSLCFCILLWMLGVYVLFILNGNLSIFALSVFLFLSVAMKK